MLFDNLASGNKLYMEFAEGNHMLVANGGGDLSTIGKFTLAFLKVYLEGKENLRPFISEPGSDYSERFSRYELQ
jgi:hypothetical protein